MACCSLLADRHLRLLAFVGLAVVDGLVTGGRVALPLLLFVVGLTEGLCVGDVGICVGWLVGFVGWLVGFVGRAEDGAEVGLQDLEDLACNLRERRICLGTESLPPNPSFIRR